MANMIPISTVTVGSGGASIIRFSNIPQNYTDVMLKVSGKATQTSTILLLTLQVNDSTTMTWRNAVSEGTTAGSYVQSAYGATSNAIGGLPGTVSGTTNTFGSYDLYFPNYSSALPKSFLVDSAFEGNIAGSYIWMLSGSLASSTPITSISVLPESSYTFAQYSSATLYGIRKY